MAPSPAPPPVDCVEILDALSERGRFRFTIRTALRSADAVGSASSLSRVLVVARWREDFVRLARRLAGRAEHAGCLVPAPPPAPDFGAASSGKLALLRASSAAATTSAGGAGDSGRRASVMTSEEYGRVKLELEAEYRHAFRKTMDAHQAFLRSLVEHPVLQLDSLLRDFLTLEETGCWDSESHSVTDAANTVVQSLLLHSGLSGAVEVASSSRRRQAADGDLDGDGDEFFAAQRRYAHGYCQALKQVLTCLDGLVLRQKGTADAYIRVSCAAQDLSRLERIPGLSKVLSAFGDFCESHRRVETNQASEFDTELVECLHRFAEDSSAAVDLMDRRRRTLEQLQAAAERLRRARAGSGPPRPSEEAEAARAQLTAFAGFNEITDSGRLELLRYRKRWLVELHRRLVALGELRAEFARRQAENLQETIDRLRSA